MRRFAARSVVDVTANNADYFVNFRTTINYTIAMEMPLVYRAATGYLMLVTCVVPEV